MQGYFHSFEQMTSNEFEEGIRIKSLPLGNVQVRYMEFEPESLISDHQHPEEVVTMILEGEMEMTVGKETKRVKSGDVFVVPPKTNHSGRIFGDRVIAVSWSPVG